MNSLGEHILERAKNSPEGTPLLAKELLHLGSRAAVDQALSRLVRSGQLLRAGRGVYVRQVESRFGVRPPSISKVVEAIASSSGETVVPNGASSANALGLTTQVPVRHVYLTSGRTRRVSVGAQTVELRHAPPWQLVLPDGRPGQVLRALAWLGEKNATKAIGFLREKLSAIEIQQLAAARKRLPTWVAAQVSTLAHG